MSRQKTHHTKQFKLDAINYRKEHPDLTQVECAKNLGIGVLVCITVLRSCRITVVWIKSLFIFILQVSCSVIRIVNVKLIYIVVFFFKLVKTVISVLVYEFAILLNLGNIAVVIIRIIVWQNAVTAVWLTVLADKVSCWIFSLAVYMLIVCIKYELAVTANSSDLCSSAPVIWANISLHSKLK